MVELEDSYALGLDLGTTNSCIGVYRNGEVEIIPNKNGEKITPSIVTIKDENTILKGEETLNYLVQDYDSTIYSIKRFIGRQYDDKKVQADIKKENFPFKIIGDKDTKNPIVIITKNNKEMPFTLEEISSFVIRKLVDNAEKFLHKKVSKLVITVPANFDNAQRNCTKQAAILAGIEVLRIINEPTAAALAYGLQDKENTSNGKILVFDLGGGTFDVTILKINKSSEDIFEVVSTKGNKFLGGEDFDNKLVNYFLDNFCRKMGEKKENIMKDKKLIKRLKISCENIKRVLSSTHSTVLSILKFYNEKDLIEEIKREEFEEICNDLFEELKIPLNDALKDAKIIAKDIKEIILAGGSTRIPKIKTFLKEYFGDNVKINDSINPDEAVAYGATLMAAKIVIKRDKYLSGFNLMDINPLSLGVNVINKSENPDIFNEGDLMSVVIKRASNIPCNFSENYQTAHDYQKVSKFKIYEGEKKYVKYNHYLGELSLKNLPPKPKGEVKFKVNFFIDINGILTVTAYELSPEGKELRSVETEIEYQSIGLNNEKLKQLKEKNKKYLAKINTKFIKDYSNTREKLKELKNALKETNDEEERYNILMAYNNTYEEFINSLDKNFDNETMLERYYLYMKELFESYEKLLKSSIEDKSKKLEKSQIIDNIKNYIKIFTQKSTGYLFNLLDIFQNIPKKFFFEIVIFTIGEINECGKQCLKERKEFCRYNCLMYFERAIALFNKYIIDISEIPSFPLDLKKNCKSYLELSLLYINDIKTGAILLLEDSIKTGKLISNNSGFTNQIVGLKFTKEENNLKYEFILQNYEKMLRELNQDLDITTNRIPINRSPNIKEAICIANIVKISYSFLGKSNLKRLIRLCGQCEVIARELDKTNEEWYQEFEKIYEEISSLNTTLEENMKEIRNNIRKEYKDEFDELERKFNGKKNNREFIEFILKNYPYNGYKEDENSKKIDYSKEENLVLFLRSKYLPDQYEFKDDDKKSQKIYCIVEMIESYLNNISENIQ